MSTKIGLTNEDLVAIEAQPGADAVPMLIAEVRRLRALTEAYERYNRASKSLVETSDANGDMRAAVAEFQAADAALIAKGGVS